MEENGFNKIVRKAISGDQKAFARVCEEKAQSILYLCVKIMGNFHDGEDAAQEILLMMQRDIVKIQNPDAFKTWLYRLIVRNCTKMKTKLYQSSGLPIDEYEEAIGEIREEFLPHSLVENEENKKRLMQAIDGLPDDCRVCVLLFYFEGLKYTEIADALSMTTNDVGNLLVKAKKLLQRQLGPLARPETLGLSAVTAMGAVPVITSLLTEDAAVVASSAVVQKLLQNAGIGNAAGLAGGSAAKSVGLKVAAGFAVVAVISAAVATGFAVAGSSAGQLPPAPSVSASVPAPAESLPLVVNTLDDMLEKENADILRRYGEEGAGDAQLIRDFLLSVDMEHDYTTNDAETQVSYEVYHRYRADKLLMVIVRVDAGSADVAFRFTQGDEPLLHHIEAYFNFEGWQQQQTNY